MSERKWRVRYTGSGSHDLRPLWISDCTECFSWTFKSERAYLFETRDNAQEVAVAMGPAVAVVEAIEREWTVVD